MIQFICGITDGKVLMSAVNKITHVQGSEEMDNATHFRKNISTLILIHKTAYIYSLLLDYARYFCDLTGSH
jgi:hypothetical protein